MHFLCMCAGMSVGGVHSWVPERYAWIIYENKVLHWEKCNASYTRLSMFKTFITATMFLNIKLDNVWSIKTVYQRP